METGKVGVEPGPRLRPGPPMEPGWHPDPTGRFRFRWFDGEGWSAEVSDGSGIRADRRLVAASPGRKLGPCLLALLPGLVLVLLVALAVKV